MQFAFSSRHLGYKIGLVSLYIVTILFLVGNLTPQWLHYSKTELNVPIKGGIIRYREVSAFSSVLTGCFKERMNGTYNPPLSGFFSSDSNTCGTGFFVKSAGGGWVHVCQAFEVTGALVLLLACIYTIRVNFCKSELGPRRPFVEIAALAAGVLGFLGSIIFVGKLGSTVRGSQHYSFAWTLFFTIFTSILLVVNGVVIAFFNRTSAYQSLQ
ncbi:uncharacterized protein LOC143280417 [Babylonia areolata]|uniref:uncharacterized protein LOC143280417 n=1 Tax=Babylonia areolata TaxID=304850 RepID=UPI003FD23D53